MKYLIIIIILFLFSLKSLLGSTLPRNEVSRYTLLNDRMMIDKELITQKHSSFLELELGISSGIKKLIGEVSDATENVSSQVQKELNIYKLMSKNTNTEKFIKLNIATAAPLPLIKYNKYKFLPSLFYSLDLGVSFSFSNTDNALNPIAQIYFKKDKKIGINTKVNCGNPNEIYDISIYKLERSDIYSQSTKTDIAADGKLYNFNDISKKHVMWSLDLAYKKKNGLSNYLIDIQELQLLSSSSTTLKSLYGTSPLIHLSFFRNVILESSDLSFYIGHHYRKKYTLLDGLYVASKVMSKSLPILFTTKISAEALTLIPELKTKYFHMFYKLKTPYRNPVDDMWVSAIHTLYLSFPFF